jgi:hypothetical protein
MDMSGPVVRVPLGHGDKVAVFVGWWAGSWVERAGVWLARALGFGESVVEGKNRVFRSVCAELLFVFALYDWERVHDIGHGITGSRKIFGKALRLAPPFFV